MPSILVEGGTPLRGKTKVSGAKNAALPILAGAILLDGITEISNVPPLEDTKTMFRMLNALGIRTEFYVPDQVKIWNNKKIRHIAPYELVTAMRASFFVAGPLLARTGYAKVSLPGGCTIGTRPVDIHLKGFEALGAKVGIEHGFVELQAKALKGTRIQLDFPSVGATENIMMAATLADGDTIIENAAREPEITDLGRFLNAAGAKISGLDTASIHIQGVQQLSGTTYRIIPDRVEAATLLIVAAMTGGDVFVDGAHRADLGAVLDLLKAANVGLEEHEKGIRAFQQGPIQAVDFETQPYPGFPTDVQAQMMSLMTIAKGRSVIAERIFENRFRHAQELIRMGANIKLDDHHAIVTGVAGLSGADVRITDLRAGAALIMAGLVADGYTKIHGLKHLNRGYDDLTGKLCALGAKIQSDIVQGVLV